MAKKRKKPNTRKLKESIPTTHQLNNKLKMWKYLKLIWTIWGITATLLSFSLGYLALRPSVQIDYASHLIPKNTIALPIKITNLGLLPIYNVSIDVIHDSIIGLGNIQLIGNIYTIDITNKLSFHKSIEYIYDKVLIPLPRDFKSHGIIVTVHYELPIITKVFDESQKFSIFKSQDGYFRWITIQ